MWDTILQILALLMLAGFGLIGVALTVFQLPGTWLIVAAAAGYTLLLGTAELPWLIVLIVAGMAGVAEIVEFVSGAVVAHQGGASRRAVWYGLPGGILGALLLAVPIPIIGPVVGAVIGCFAGAFIAEMQEGRSFGAGTRSGVYSAIGRAFGSMAKVLAAVIMFSMVMASVFVRMVS
jgi:uncharacterized protein YqgC (DUF456 family)